MQRSNGTLKQGQTSQVGVEGAVASSHTMKQNLSKNIAQKQQKLLRNQIFKSSDYTKSHAAQSSSMSDAAPSAEIIGNKH